MREKGKQGKNKKNQNKWSLKVIIILFILAPIIVNYGLIITDEIYKETGTILTAKGLNNADWLDFWKQYLAIVISFIGIVFVYISAEKDRKRKIYERRAERYLEGIKHEQEILVDITQAFDTSVIIDAFLEQKSLDLYAGKKHLTDAQMKVAQAHIKFELQTYLCDDLKKCEGCKYDACFDKEITIELRNLFYEMEKDYNEMLIAGEVYLEKINQIFTGDKILEYNQRLRENLLKIIDLYGYIGNQSDLEKAQWELKDIEKEIHTLKEQRFASDEMERLQKDVRDKLERINQQKRPQFIRKCQDYFKIKKKHLVDIEELGYIRFEKKK